MSSLISLVAAAAVLLHMLLGCCCSHHQHRVTCGADTAAETAADAARCYDDHGRFVGDAGDADAPLGPCSPHGGRHECEGGACAFLTSATPSVDLRADLLAHWTAADLVSGTGSFGQFHAMLRHAAEGRPPRHSDRLQKRLGIWLI